MDIKKFTELININTPTIEEVSKRLIGEEIDAIRDYQEQYILKTNGTADNKFDRLIDELIENTNIHTMLLGVISFNHKISYEDKYELFGMNNDTTYLGIDTKNNEVVELDLQNQFIIQSYCAKSIDEFLQVVTFLFKIDTDFEFRDISAPKGLAQTLSEIVGGDKYFDFYDELALRYS